MVMQSDVAETKQWERILKEIDRLSFVEKLQLMSKLSGEIGTGIAQYQSHLERNKSAQSKYLHLPTDKLTYEKSVVQWLCTEKKAQRTVKISIREGWKFILKMPSYRFCHKK